MSEPLTIEGPAHLRVAAADLRRVDWPETAAHLEKMAALWEADIFTASRAAQDRTAMLKLSMVLQESEESVDRLQSSKAALQAEIKDLYAQRDAETKRATRAEAALERARALWIRWRDTLCLFPQLEKFVEAADAALTPIRMDSRMEDIWYLIENEEEFKAHVKKRLGVNGHVYGLYPDPEAYPVLVHKDYDIRYNGDGPDDILLDFYYPEHVVIVRENYEETPR